MVMTPIMLIVIPIMVLITIMPMIMVAITGTRPITITILITGLLTPTTKLLRSLLSRSSLRFRSQSLCLWLRSSSCLWSRSSSRLRTQSSSRRSACLRSCLSFVQTKLLLQHSLHSILHFLFVVLSMLFFSWTLSCSCSEGWGFLRAEAPAVEAYKVGAAPEVNGSILALCRMKRPA